MIIWSEQPEKGVMKVIFAKGKGEIIEGPAEFRAEGTELSRDEVRTGMTWKV